MNTPSARKTVTLLDDATRPVPPKLEGLTAAQRMPGQHLKMFHDHFRENMTRLRTVIAEAEAGTISTEELEERAENLPILDNYRRFGSLCGQHCQMIHGHHSIEDAYIFPVLSEKAEAFRRVVARLMEEHEIVHALLMNLVDDLNAVIRTPSPETFATARDTYATLEKLLLSHFKYEEDSIGDALGYYDVGV